MRNFKKNIRLGKDEDMLENIIDRIIVENIHVFCLQETWKNGTFVKSIRGYIMFHHGTKNRSSECGRNSGGEV